MTENLRKIEAALRGDKALAEEFKAELKRLVEEKSIANKGEAAVKAAQEVGFDVTLADLEKVKAAAQELDPEEMSKVAGGGNDFAPAEETGTCFVNYNNFLTGPTDTDEDIWEV